jgi:uncharacterized alkaline shock family protein YloU
MSDARLKMDKKKVDTKEFELPETIFIRDIENKVFQSIVLQCLAQIDGISLVEGNFIDHLLGRGAEGVKGISAEQDDKHQSVNIKVEVNIFFGLVIPQKAEEIQTKITEDITKLTGLHVSSVHVVFKNVISPEEVSRLGATQGPPTLMGSNLGEEYSDEF